MAACIAVIRAAQQQGEPRLRHSASAAGSLASAGTGGGGSQEAPGTLFSGPETLTSQGSAQPSPAQPATPGQAPLLAPLPRPGSQRFIGSRDGGGDSSDTADAMTAPHNSGGQSEDDELTSEDVARLQRRLADFGVSD